MSTDDPEIDREEEFERHVLEQIRGRLDRRTDGELVYDVIEKFGLDACFVISVRRRLKLRLVEFKAFKGQRQGGVGFGSGQGRGPQVDLLRLSNDLIIALDTSVRWCFAALLKPRGSSRYSLITSEMANRSAMGLILPGCAPNIKA